MFKARQLRTDPETEIAQHAVRGLINDAHLISEHDWAVSIVRRKGTQHAFLVIEGKKDNQYCIFRSDFFLDLSNKPFAQDTNQITSAINYLWGSSQSIGGRGFIRIKEINVEELEAISKSSEFQSWGLKTAQAEILLKKLLEEANKPHTYHVAGNHSTWSSSTSRSNNQNCVGWCQDVLKDVLGLEIGDFWGTIVQDPRRALRLIIEKEKQPEPSLHQTPGLRY